jgi:MoaA/NifB/PqqE/SkfB family radical SAM enzyme
MPLELIDDILRQARPYGIRHVSLTGGEPTLHPHFVDVIDKIVAHEFVWDMVTNGRRFGAVAEMCESVPARRHAIRSITLSLDGASEATHDAIRGAGSYREVMAAISIAAVREVPFGLQMAVHARNQQEVEALGFLAAQLGAKHVAFAMTQPTGTHLDSSLFLPASEWSRIHERIEKLAAALAIRVIAPEGYPRRELLALCGPMRGETLHVDLYGRLSLCCLHSQVPGGEDRAVAGEVGSQGFTAAHHRLLEIIHDAQRARLRALERGELNSPWGRFPCNSCLAHFGKPHWTDQGTEGPRAARERWRGARTRLNIVPSDDSNGPSKAARQ